MGLGDLFFMALHMVRELMMDYPHVTSLIVLCAVLPWGFAISRKLSSQDWKRVWKPALTFSLICGALAFVLLPTFFHSGLGHMNYLTDWLFHIASTLSIMVYAWLIAVPALLLWCNQCSK